MSTPRTDKAAKSGDWPMETLMESRRLETELAAVTKERDAFRAAFCNGPAYDTGETPEQARERFEKNGFIEGVSAVIIARELQKELAAERAKVEMLRDVLQITLTQFSFEAIRKALAETAPKEETK
jgi:hypothetical protein